ncbi:MAG: hypothetical protein HKN78_00855 [Sphingomonadaceae bacterium]|nr:hypothetical protein [Sphingomonadaceae bacterium]
MLFILGLALLPLGLIMLLSSLDTAEAARQGRIDEATLIADSSARKLGAAIDNTATGLRAATTATAIDEVDGDRCTLTLRALASLEDYQVHLAIFNRRGALLCATPAFAPRFSPPPRDRALKRITLDADVGSLRIVIAGANGNAFGVAEFPPETIAAITVPTDQPNNFEIRLGQRGEWQIIHGWDEGRAPKDPHVISRTIADDQIRVDAAFAIAPMRLPEMLSIGLPLLMWLAAALLGWFLVNRILLRPLSRLQSAVARYGIDGADFVLPETGTIAREIRELGSAFGKTVDALAANRRELEAGLAEQQRLTREVHHRVKNNLQVIASLLNLHAREAISDDASAAYAGIQRRVGALAVVQRNLFAETDHREGVILRPIIAELASGLHQGAPVHSNLSLALDIADLRVTQDIAAPVAFLITEIVELALSAGEEASIEISLIHQEGAKALLSLVSESLRFEEKPAHFERYARVLEGLSRQLRSKLDLDGETGTYTITIPVIE